MSERHPFQGSRHRAARDTTHFRADAPDRVVVRIEAAGRTLEGRLEWHDASGAVIGEQSFPSRTGDCDELTRAMGFALALQVQLMAATMGETRAPPAPAPAAPPTATAPAPPPPITPSPTTQIETAGSRTSGPDDGPHGPSRVDRRRRIGRDRPRVGSGRARPAVRDRAVVRTSPSSWPAKPSPRRPRIARTGPASLNRSFWRASPAVACAPPGASARSARSASFGWPDRVSTCRSPPRA